MGRNIRRMVDKGVLDASHALSLDVAVIAKIEAMSEEDIETIIKFKLDVAGAATPFEPEPDGSIF